MIPNDFDVELIFEDETTSVFAAERQDVFHFVHASIKNKNSNFQQIDISQFHVPRFEIARALTFSAENPIPELLKQHEIRSEGDEIHISLNDRSYCLPKNLVEIIRKDLFLLKNSLTSVRFEDEGFAVLEAKTSAGFPLITEQRSLAEAIAFERKSRGFLDPSNFSVYSAYCTWRDFLRDDPTKKNSIARGMAKEMVSWDPNSFGDDSYWDSVFDIQERLWGDRYWGPGLETSEELLFNSFLKAFSNLSSIQFTQFVLMNGMHQGGPFHALATLFGWLDFDSYNSWRTRGYQPDSVDEQEIRTQSAFIRLLGISD